MEIVIFGIVGTLAGLCWLFAVASWVMAVRNRVPEVSLTTLLFQGYRAFDSDSFTEEGQRYQQRFFVGFGAFMCCIFVLIGAVVLFSSI